MTQEEVKRLLISLLPEGSEDLYALGNGDVIGGILNSLGGSLKDTIADRYDALVRNLNPSTMDEATPDWEAATGLSNAPIAIYGTANHRKQAVLAALRMRGAFSLDDIRAILQPYFLYADPSQIQIIEPDRAALKTAHTYSGSALGPAVLVNDSVLVADDPRVSPAGAILEFTVTTTRLDGLTVLVSGPGGVFYERAAGFFDSSPTSIVSQSYRVNFREFAGTPIRGFWRAEFFNTAAVNITITAWSLFVEGLGNNYVGTVPNGQGLGAAMFDFVAVADPTKLGTGYDLEGAQRSLTRWKPAHTHGGITQLSAAGTVCAIPDTTNAIPDNAVPC